MLAVSGREAFGSRAPNGIPPLRFGPYLLGRRLGTGAHARVFAARGIGKDATNLDLAAKCVRIKPVWPTFGARMLEREAQLYAAMSHPNLVSTFDFGRQGADLLLVMEDAGVSCGRVLTCARPTGSVFPLGAACWVLDQVLSALEYVHERGLVHRDVTPGNVLLGRFGGVKLLDFGIARRSTESTESRPGAHSSPHSGEAAVNRYRVGLLDGKPGFVSPEQAAGARVDPRADLYSAGATLAALVTGAPPFAAATVERTLRSAAREVWRPAKGEGLPRALRSVLDCALAPDPAVRFGSAGEFRAALQRAAACDGIDAVDEALLLSWLSRLDVWSVRAGSSR